MDDWNWDSTELNEMSTPNATRKPSKRTTLLDLFTDQILYFVVLAVALLGFKFFGGNAYASFREIWSKKINETTSLDTVLGKEKENASPSSSQTASSAFTVSASAVQTATVDPYAEYGEESDEACEFDLNDIRLLSGNKQAVNSMCMPIHSTNVTSRFGYRTHPLTGNYAMHSGLDLGADMNEPIYAALSGTVVKAKYNDDYGNFITLDHGNELVTLYAHCSKLLVQTGDTVVKGQIIAQAGSTGWSDGPHLHFEVRVKGVRIDPAPYLSSLYAA